MMLGSLNHSVKHGQLMDQIKILNYEKVGYWGRLLLDIVNSGNKWMFF